MGQPLPSSASLAAELTWRSSRQAFWTIRWLVDRQRVADAFRAYGYFRWVDDCLDLELSLSGDRTTFLARQQDVAARCYAGRPPAPSCPEEDMLIELIHNNPASEGGLASYIKNLFQVMAFDCERRGRLITAAELDGYTHSLSVAVTDALLWFIGHDQAEVFSAERYLPAAAAHMVHMLRDAHDDLPAGYVNIPVEVLTQAGMTPGEFEHPAYRAWVRERVELAKDYFRQGRDYLAQLDSLRCRLACFAYQERFVWLLGAIERTHYILQPAYPIPGLLGRARQGASPFLRAAARAPAPA
jgi:phytoene/squalene synthetase